MASFIRGALHILSLNGIPNYDLVKTIHESHITVNGQRFVDKNATYTVPHPEHICHILYYLHFLSRYLQHKITFFFSTLFAFCIVCFLFCWFVLFFFFKYCYCIKHSLVLKIVHRQEHIHIFRTIKTIVYLK